MQQEIFCGIDFGTSNSSIAVAGKHLNPQLIPLENQKKYNPVNHILRNRAKKTIFWNTSHRTLYLRI